jgi:hypothetical protein
MRFISLMPLLAKSGRRDRAGLDSCGEECISRIPDRQLCDNDSGNRDFVEQDLDLSEVGHRWLNNYGVVMELVRHSGFGAKTKPQPEEQSACSDADKSRNGPFRHDDKYMPRSAYTCFKVQGETPLVRHFPFCDFN